MGTLLYTELLYSTYYTIIIMPKGSGLWQGQSARLRYGPLSEDPPYCIVYSIDTYNPIHNLHLLSFTVSKLGPFAILTSLCNKVFLPKIVINIRCARTE